MGVGTQPASTYAASAITGRHGEARELVLLSVLMLVRIGLLKVRTAELMLPDRTPASRSSHGHLPPRFGARWLSALAGAIFDALPVLWIHRPSERLTDRLADRPAERLIYRRAREGSVASSSA